MINKKQIIQTVLINLLIYFIMSIHLISNLLISNRIFAYFFNTKINLFFMLDLCYFFIIIICIIETVLILKSG